MTTNIAADRLRNFIERIERLNEELTHLKGDVKEVYNEASGEGYDVKTIKKIIAIRKKDRASRQEEESLLELYMTALGL